MKFRWDFNFNFETEHIRDLLTRKNFKDITVKSKKISITRTQSQNYSNLNLKFANPAKIYIRQTRVKTESEIHSSSIRTGAFGPLI